MWGKVSRWILEHEAIFIILAVVVLLRVPSLFEPYWYGDEGIYLTVGRSLRHGLALYRDVHDNKPPLLYLVAAAAYGVQFWFKFIAMLWSVAVVAIFWNLALRFAQNKRGMVVWATIIFAGILTLPFLEGNIANAELFFLLLTVGAFSIIYKGGDLIQAGALFGLAGLFKMPAVLEAGVWPIIWLISQDKKWFAKSWWLGVGAAIPLGLATIYFAIKGTLPQFLGAAGIQLVPYLSSWRVDLPVVGTLAGRAAVLVVWLLVSWLLRKRLSHNGLILAIWWGVTLFAALLSGRPYPHYLLQMAAVIALTVTIEKKLAVGLITVLLSVFVAFKFYVYPVWGYYENFGKWVTGQQSHNQYFAWFNPQVENNYEIAKRIMAGSSPEEKIFVWGDEPMIYALAKRKPAGRYTVRYHILEFGAQKQTADLLRSEPPRYIVSFGQEKELPGLQVLLTEKYIPEGSVGAAKIYRLWKKF